jgi:phage gpG-like protein
MAIDQQGFDRVVSFFSELQDIEPILKNIGVKLTNDSKLNFRQQSDPQGKPWQPIKRQGQILVDTGRLRSSIANKVNLALGEVEIGTNVQYAKAHNEGFSGQVNIKSHVRKIDQAFGRKIAPRSVQVSSHKRQMNIPKREFLGFYQRQESIVNRVIEQWLNDLTGQYAN